MIILMIVFLCLMGVLLMAFIDMDRLVKIEYGKYREDWIKDGKPRGFVWKPPESSPVSGGLAMQRLSVVWLFRTPMWANQDLEAMERLHRLRLYVLIFNIGVVIWAVACIGINT